jgi:hypothetical protein
MNARASVRTRLLRCNVLCMAMTLGCFCCTPPLCFSEVTNTDDESSSALNTTPAVAQIERGITGTFAFRYDGPMLRVRTQRDAEAPLVVRLRRLDGVGEFESSFIGTREGVFDLRESLEHADGSTADNLPTMPITVVSTLPNDQRSDLFEAVDFEPSLMGGYRLALATVAIFWLMTPVTIMVLRFWRRPPHVQPVPPPPEPNWGERLEPLLLAAAKRLLSAEEQGRLELLLLHYWRERSEIGTDGMAESIRKLRSQPDAGPILLAVEQWLHRSRKGTANESGRWPAEVQKLLEPLCRQIACKPPELGTPELGTSTERAAGEAT